MTYITDCSAFYLRKGHRWGKFVT